MSKPPTRHRSHGLFLLSTNMQFTAGFVIPTAILFYLSGASRLGPLRAMLIALAFPLVLELYSLRSRRKPSLISIISIMGISFIGAISMLGLSEQWLAFRRSGIYVVAAFGLITAMHFKRGLIDKALGHVINTGAVHAAAKEKSTEAQLARHINRAGYALAGFLLLLGIATYILTIVYITAPLGTSKFNTEYAQLRVLSIIFITGPLLIGSLGLLAYLVTGFAKFTGIKAEELLKKKR